MAEHHLTTPLTDADVSKLRAGDVERYVTLLQRGLYGAAYLEIGLGRPDVG